MEAPVKRTIQFSFLFLTCTALGWGQAQATTGVIQGTIADPTGAAVPDARVEAKNLDTNFTRSQDSDASGRFALLQMPPGRYTVTASKPGFATMVQENLELTVGQALSLTISMRISSVSEEITITAEPVDVTRVESSTTLNEQLCWAAWRLQQHLRRWWRLQQRILRRASRRPARRRGHQYGSREGVPGCGHRRQCGVRPHGRRRGQRHHQIRHKRRARQPVSLPAAGSSDCQYFGRQTASGFPPRAVRRKHRRTDCQEQSVLLRHVRADLRKSPPRQSEHRHRCSLFDFSSCCGHQRHGDRGQRRLPAAGVDQLLQDPFQSGRKPARHPLDQ
ncbi:MAG: hypothetical protein DMG12_26590 [Acidobacteria bacterium]|nr:MAG: hypothetical protein DMG12_26590 [Acidobacteriota bacterium]